MKLATPMNQLVITPLPIRGQWRDDPGLQPDSPISAKRHQPGIFPCCPMAWARVSVFSPDAAERKKGREGARKNVFAAPDVEEKLTRLAKNGEAIIQQVREKKMRSVSRDKGSGKEKKRERSTLRATPPVTPVAPKKQKTKQVEQVDDAEPRPSPKHQQESIQAPVREAKSSRRHKQTTAAGKINLNGLGKAFDKAPGQGKPSGKKRMRQ